MSERHCTLLGGWFAVFIQLGLAVLCIMTLVYKRYGEHPKRDWVVWSLDVMKQGFGATYGHFANILMSATIAKGLPSGDECQWYCLNFVIDSTFGTFFNISILMVVELIMSKYSKGKSKECLRFGAYGSPPSLNSWFGQLIVWIIIISLGKLIILPVLIYLSSPLNDIISIVFSSMSNYPDVELVIVMVIVPLILNTLQFWLQDSYLKQRGFMPLLQAEGEEILSMQVCNIIK